MSRCTCTRALTVLVATAIVVAGRTALHAQPTDAGPLRSARALATAGGRTESLALLEDRLAHTPGDLDARFLRGLVLSWERRFDESRRDLRAVLAQAPSHTDARLALANVEWWSEAYARLDEVAREGETLEPHEVRWPIYRARALAGQARYDEARTVLNGVLQRDAGSSEARALRDQIASQLRPWTATTSVNRSWFSDGRDAWTEAETSVARRLHFGHTSVRLGLAQRGPVADRLMEWAVTARVSPKTSVAATAGAAETRTLYPAHRIGFDVNHGFGAGIEASLGWRRLHFARAATIYNATVAKYLGAWMISGRASYVPPAATNRTAAFGLHVRRSFGRDGQSYAGVSLGRGFVRDELRSTVDLATYDARTAHAELRTTVSARWRLGLSGGTAMQATGRRHVRQHSLSALFDVVF